MPMCERTREVVGRRLQGETVRVGMSPALVVGQPTALVGALFLIPAYILLAVVLPGNQFLPLASLAGLFYIFPMVLPFTRGNVLKSCMVGFTALLVGLWFVTDMAPDFTKAAASVYAQTHDKAAHVPEGFLAGSMDFVSSILSYGIYALVKYLRFVGAAVLAVLALGMMMVNRRRIVAEERRHGQS